MKHRVFHCGTLHKIVSLYINYRRQGGTPLTIGTKGLEADSFPRKPKRFFF